MAEPTPVNQQITDAITAPATPERARTEQRYVLADEQGLCVELGWDTSEALARLHIAFIDHETPCPFVPSGTRLPLTLAPTLELGGHAEARALGSWLERQLELGEGPPAAPIPGADAAKIAHSVSQGRNTVSLVWEAAEQRASLALRCIELPVHVFNDGFSARSCRVSTSFELPMSRDAAAQLCTWLAAVSSEPAQH